MDNSYGRGWVEIVTADGDAVEAARVTDAHTLPGRLHRAFSVLLFDDHGRVLLQRRAAAKAGFGELWANSCCSHPEPGADIRVTARRRVREELGLRVDDLEEVGCFTYRAVDPRTDWVEHEFDHVLVGRAQGEPRLDPAEASAWVWADPAWLRTDIAAHPDLYAPWLPGVLDLAKRDG